MFTLILMLVAIIALFLMALVLLTQDNGLLQAFGVLGCMTSALAIVIYIILIWGWVAADYQKDVLNKAYGTAYTQEEVYFASSVIDLVREVQRQRIEVTVGEQK